LESLCDRFLAVVQSQAVEEHDSLGNTPIQVIDYWCAESSVGGLGFSKYLESCVAKIGDTASLECDIRSDGDDPPHITWSVYYSLSLCLSLHSLLLNSTILPRRVIRPLLAAPHAAEAAQRIIVAFFSSYYFSLVSY